MIFTVLITVKNSKKEKKIRAFIIRTPDLIPAIQYSDIIAT